MRRAFLALVCLWSACATSPAPRTEVRPVVLVLPEVGARYAVLHRVRVRFDGAEEGVLRARLVLEVVARREAELDLRIEASLLEEDRSVAAFDELEVTLDATGQLHAPVRSRCADPDFDELVSTRLVSAILGSRPLRTSDDLRALSGVVSSELDETHAPVTFARQADAALLDVRAQATLALRAATLFGAHYRGSVSAQVHHRLSLGDLLEGRSITTLSGEVEAHRSAGTRRALLEVTSETEVRRLSAEEGRAEGRHHCAVGFSSDVVIRAVGDRLQEIQSCYDDALASDATLRGRVRVEFTVTPAGESTEVTSSGDLLTGANPAWDGVVSCVMRLIDSLSFGSGPAESTRFAYPFVFEPAP